jgi:hypothetical protein
MKLKNVLAGVVATVALTGVAVAQPQGMGPAKMDVYGSGYRMGQGMMGGGSSMVPGMMFGYTNDAYAGLDLTPDQQKSIASIQE